MERLQFEARDLDDMMPAMREAADLMCMEGGGVKEFLHLYESSLIHFEAKMKSFAMLFRHKIEELK